MRPLLVLVLFSVTACAPRLKKIEADTVARGIDFRPHVREGFLFSPNPYPGQFDPIGLVTVAVYADGEKVPKPRSGGATMWKFSVVGAQDALTAARREAAALGADAVVNLSIKPVTRSVLDRRLIVEVPGVEVTGFAIKRR